MKDNEYFNHSLQEISTRLSACISVFIKFLLALELITYQKWTRISHKRLKYSVNRNMSQVKHPQKGQFEKWTIEGAEIDTSLLRNQGLNCWLAINNDKFMRMKPYIYMQELKQAN